MVLRDMLVSWQISFSFVHLLIIDKYLSYFSHQDCFIGHRFMFLESKTRTFMVAKTSLGQVEIEGLVWSGKAGSICSGIRGSV